MYRDIMNIRLISGVKTVQIDLNCKCRLVPFDQLSKSDYKNGLLNFIYNYTLLKCIAKRMGKFITSEQNVVIFNAADCLLKLVQD
ncbi:hypothetical protein T02_14640 [Trichinella nativa]|uniref:Uncharacterized protein n=1 Tax=Trichinella nativa TaxID=6335 RepID=A0A0V1KWT6_9BILA|nr:hypothetical protein T06_2881 [Trichinella sp. T6]KRZ51780.1 hypothetical protein T02_14640 [Trichinella nativa]